MPNVEASGGMCRRGFLGRLRLGLGLGVGVTWGVSAFGAQSRVEDLLGLGQRWLEDNLDSTVLDAVRSGDSSQIDRLLQGLAQGLQGDSVVELAGFRDAATLALPWLERDARTKAYVPWLRARLDYFRVAEVFKTRSKSVAPAPGQKSVPAPNPTPKQEREVWQEQVRKDPAPAPKGAAVWVPKLKPVLRQAGAPPQLVWLAEIESSFEPTARSPAGAVGMFQLMGPTAQGLGLKLQPKDERLVPELSARAAGTYLRKLYVQFKEWRLALAAYNAGPGRVADLMKKRRATSYDAVAPVLPAETQMYVPKFEAVLAKREKTTLAALKLPA